MTLGRNESRAGVGPDPERDAGPVGEHRLPPVIATLVAVVLYALLPDSLLLGPRVVIPVIEVALLVALVATNPWRMARQSRWSRIAALALAVLVIVSNLVSLGLLVTQLGSDADGMAMLRGAMQVWGTNVIGFALVYWELDRGGPVARRMLPRNKIPRADWRFSQDENHGAVDEVRASSSEDSDWRPVFADYLYLSVTNSSAFSPTDTMPLSSRAKLLMATQATAALLTSLLVVARAVGSLTGG
ncbi:hypothetical protein MM440_07020 [Arsenicicoccus piscis]|uniref:hypothetical protein n=1 Tax=Arsenicicoccus piscis TaxID=673954 RepID=UPI001F4CDFA6|nr:hypothetical protein [Arsenicicoccus piscis]MCH8627541.1 hypothetical protein [Arsenicicoccus piscis]